MRIAAAVNLVIGLILAWLVGVGISLDSPVRLVAWAVSGLMLLAALGAALKATWGPRLGQVVGGFGSLIGILTMASGVLAYAQGGEFSDLAGAVLLMLGAGMSVGFGAALFVNSRARDSSG